MTVSDRPDGPAIKQDLGLWSYGPGPSMNGPVR